MTYKTRDFTSLLGMKGFSEDLLKDHFALYEGYVSSTNELSNKVRALSGSDTPEFSELVRRLGWEFNGMRLHELYFSNLGGRGGLPDDELARSLEKEFGDVSAWSKDFRAVGATRGVGWTILYHDPDSDRFMNVWIDEHHTNHPAGCTPLLVMDVWEHAFVRDYGTDREAYIDAFMENVDWSAVDARLSFAAEAVSTG